MVAKMIGKKILTIEGDAIDDIASFYDEINRVFMSQEDWKLGPNLDALNDMLHGGYGAIGGEPITIVWRNMDRSRAVLGLDATRDFYRKKLMRPDIFDADRIKRDLNALEDGSGPTYFEIILEIIADHPNIELRDE